MSDSPVFPNVPESTVGRRMAFVLPGLGRVRRGAEAALSRIAAGLRDRHGWQVELFGSGDDFPFDLDGHVVQSVSRERFEKWPKVPGLRTECQYEEMTFALGLVRCRAFDASRFDAVMTCSYPYINWLLQRPAWQNVHHTFITQNGDWMCRRVNAEYRYFDCDSLACITPEQYVRHQDTFDTHIIPNGVDIDRFTYRVREGSTTPHVLMVGALIESKRILEGIKAVSRVPGAWLTIVGDGPLRDDVQAMLENLMPGHSTLALSVAPDDMPAYYDAADVFLHMSQDEPFGLVYLEAAAAGCPIVAHAGQTQEWILDDTAHLCDTNESALVADGIDRLSRPNQAAEFGRRAFARVEAEWAWDRQVDRYQTLLSARVGAPEGDTQPLVGEAV